MSFRVRLLVASSATLALGIGTLLVFANLLLSVQVQHEASSVLGARAQAQIAALSVVGGQLRERAAPNEARLDRAAWIFAGGRLVESAPDAPTGLTAAAVALSRGLPGAERDGPGGQRLRVEPVYAGHPRKQVGAVVVAYAAHPLHVLQAEVLLGSIVFAVLALIGGAIVIGRAIRRALEPVAIMIADAENWGAHDLDRRFALGPVRDELTGLGAVLDGLLSRIAASRHHEQRFAAEVAHELRTPLAAVRGWSELALMGAASDAEADRQPLEAIVDQVDHMEATVDTLLQVARRELDADAGTADLRPLLAELEGVQLQITGELPLVEGDAAVVRQLLAPLIDNARRHAASTVRVQAGTDGGSVRVAVRDDGPGVDPAVAEAVFQPGARSADGAGSGAGLGLALARRLARACGGDIVLGPGPGGHFVVVLTAVSQSG